MKSRMLGVWLLIGAALLAPARAAEPSEKLAALAVRTWTLPNGLQVAYLEAKGAANSCVQLWYRAGSKDELRSQQGLAQLVEFMAGQGSTRVRPGGHEGLIAQVGGTPGSITTEDATGFTNIVPGKYFRFAMELEAERMRNVLFREEALAAAKRVMREEILALGNDPFKRAVWAFLGQAFEKHSYAWEVSGSIATLDRLTLADAKSFYDRFYVPSNALLVIVGDIAEDSARKASEEIFGNLPTSPVPTRTISADAEPAQTQPRYKLAEAAEIGIVVQGYHLPAAKDPDIYALQLLSVLAGVGENARLQTELVVKQRIAEQAGASALVREHPGLFVSYAAFAEPDQQKAVEAALSEQLKRFAREKVAAAELTRAKRLVVGTLLYALDGVSGLANHIGTSWILTGDAAQFARDIAKIDALTAEDLQRAAAKYLSEKQQITVVVPVKS